MRTNWKRVVICLLALLMALSTVACGTGGTTGTTGSGEPGETLDNTDREPVTITFGGWGDYFLLVEQCEAFMKKYPWITVEVVKPVGQDWYTQDLIQLAAIGEMPDVFNITDLPSAMQNEWCLDITDYFRDDPESATYPEWMLPYCESNGRLYTLISTLYVDLVEVNTDILDENNITIPKYDWTVDEWASILRNTSVKGETLGTGDMYRYLQWLPAQMGNPDIAYYCYNTATGKFEFGDEFIETVNILRELINDEVAIYNTMDRVVGITTDGVDAAQQEAIEAARFDYMQSNYGSTDNFWVKGLLAMETGSSWALNWDTFNANIYTGFDWDIYPFPVKNEGDASRVCMLNEFLAVSATTEHPYESYLLMKYMSYDLDGFEAKVNFMSSYDKKVYMEKYDGLYSPTSYATTLFIYQMPPSTDERAIELYERINPNMDKEGLKWLFSNMNNGGFLNGVRVIPGHDEIIKIICDTVQHEVVLGNKTAADIAKDLEDRCNQILLDKRIEYGLNG